MLPEQSLYSREQIFKTFDDTTSYFLEDRAVAMLLAEGVCHVEFEEHADYPTMTVVVTGSDVMAWGMSEGVEIRSEEELRRLTDLHLQDRQWGAVQWIAERYHRKPQKPMEDRMREVGSWTEELEALPRNDSHDYCCPEHWGAQAK